MPGLGLNELRQHGEEVLRKYRVILADLIFTKRAAKALVKPSEQRETVCVSTLSLVCHGCPPSWFAEQPRRRQGSLQATVGLGPRQ